MEFITSGEEKMTGELQAGTGIGQAIWTAQVWVTQNKPERTQDRGHGKLRKHESGQLTVDGAQVWEQMLTA